MGAYNVINRASMAAGQPEDVSVILANLDAIAAVLNGGIDNSNINAAAAILYSKLNLANSIKNADIDPAAAIVASKLAGYPADITKSLLGDGSWGTAAYPWAHVRHSAASGTDGGALAATTWNTRPCAEVTDASGILAVAANQMTLSAGTYRVHIAAVGFHGSGRVGSRLRNVTDSTTVLVGTAGYAVDSEWVSIISGQFTIAAGKALEIQHWPGVAQAGNGMGTSVGDGEVEVYMQGEFWKIA